MKKKLIKKPTSKPKKIDWEKVKMQQDINHLKAQNYIKNGEYKKAMLMMCEIPDELLRIVEIHS